MPKSLRWKLANKLVFSQVRERMGGSVEIFVSGGAPLGTELAAVVCEHRHSHSRRLWFDGDFAGDCVESPRAHKLGTVGRPLSNVEVRIAEDKEILVSRPFGFRGNGTGRRRRRVSFCGRRGSRPETSAR